MSGIFCRPAVFARPILRQGVSNVASNFSSNISPSYANQAVQMSFGNRGGGGSRSILGILGMVLIAGLFARPGGLNIFQWLGGDKTVVEKKKPIINIHKDPPIIPPPNIPDDDFDVDFGDSFGDPNNLQSTN